MGKVFQQVVLLTRKNIRVRFSHRCLSFCELAIPGLITLLIGLFTSGSTVIHHHNRSGILEADIPSSSKPATVDDKFDCDYSYYSRRTHYCEDIEKHVNGEKYMDMVRQLRVIYILPEDGQAEGANLMARILEKSNSNPNRTTWWRRSNMTEKQLEACFFHSRTCNDSNVAVVITKIRDEVVKENRFEVEYKIRLSRQEDENTDKLFIEFREQYFESERQNSELVYMRRMSWRDWGEYEDLPYVGIVQLQAFMDRGIQKYIQAQKGGNASKLASNVNISLIRMPYISPGGDLAGFASRFITLLYSLLGSLAIFSLMRVNSEKCSGFKELLRMHGVSISTQWTAWLFSSFLVYLIWTFFLTFVLCVPILGGINVLPVLGINCLFYWLLQFLFMMSITTFSYLVSVFFERVWTAASVGLVSWIVLTVCMMVASASFTLLSTGEALFLMLLPTVAFDFAFRFLLNGGGTLRTIAVPLVENINLTLLHCLFMLLLDSCIFMVLTLYLDNVLPAKYGVRKSPLYFIGNIRKWLLKQCRFWRQPQSSHLNVEDGNDEASVEMTSIISEEHPQPFQPDPNHPEAVVDIRNLRKRFRGPAKKRAVDGLTVKMFSGEIFALLGFNGAGKTTTIGVLTGLMAPTDGTARIFDLDIRRDMEEIRKHIGLCPQHNMLYDEMTILGQVAFFGTLKGVQDPENEAKRLLTKLGLEEKLHRKPEELSGGQKRRVHLCIALIGGTKLAFLDEVTSGLDPETRRGVWDILIKLKGQVTLVLTTHDMEEADVLGDRIGIMSEGKLMCSGTPSFLKRHYGVGYNLKMRATSVECDPDQVFSLVRNFIPNAKLLSCHSSEGVVTSNSTDTTTATTFRALDSISISLPTAELDLNQLASMMDTLRENSEELLVDSIGLSLSTMDEVFLKVGESVNAVPPTTTLTDSEHSGGTFTSKTLSGSRLAGTRLSWHRFNTLVQKNLCYFLHAPWTLLFLLLFFCFILLICLVMLSVTINGSLPTDAPRVISASSLSFYRQPYIFIHDNTTVAPRSTSPLNYAVSYFHQLHNTQNSLPDVLQIKEFRKNTTTAQINRFLKSSSLQDLRRYRKHFIAGASFSLPRNSTSLSATGFYSVYALHSAPLSFNLLSQTLIKQQLGVDAKISVINHPFKHSIEYYHVRPGLVVDINKGSFGYTVKCGGVLLVLVISSLLTGTSALLPTEERLNKGKQMQLMTGTTPILYWTAMLTWDFLFFTVANFIILFVYWLADICTGNWIYTNHGAGLWIFMILECHTFASLWFCYLMSWAPCVKTSHDSFLIANKFALVVGVLFSVIRHILFVTLERDVYRDEVDVWSWLVYYSAYVSKFVLWLVPAHSLYLALMKLVSISLPNSVCNWLPQQTLQLSCQGDADSQRNTTAWYVYRCCPNCTGTGLDGDGCFKPEKYLNASSIIFFSDHRTHSMIWDCLALILDGVVCAGLLFTLEYMWGKRWRAEVVNVEEQSTWVDEDVKDEMARVEDIVMKDNAIETANHALITHKVNLNFGDIKAVKDLSFGVYPGECFGLLGVNGAGKTSTFRVLTGDVAATSGNVWAGGLNIFQQRKEYFSSLGYCPQFNGIIGALTGLQMVKMYGALRGIPLERLEEDARIWLDRFGLLASARRKCATYSGGMMRRLSAAIALIGNPRLLLLDEPTSGVDPSFRRQFWKVIRVIRKGGQSVILTSHVMDECEALCTRLGIMVDGSMKCVGNIQHLKAKFGKGYILTVKLKRVAEKDEREHEIMVEKVLEKVIDKFSPCRIQTKQKVLVQYQILSKSLWYSDIFRSMETIRALPESEEVIEEYSVTETSLEDVFISFVAGTRKNYP